MENFFGFVFFIFICWCLYKFGEWLEKPLYEEEPIVAKKKRRVKPKRYKKVVKVVKKKGVK